MIRRSWTADDIAVLREMTEAGASLKEMAVRLDTSWQMVGKMRELHGISNGRSRCERCGGPVTQPAVGRKRRFCSSTCTTAQGRERAAVRRAERKPCPQCGADGTFTGTRVMVDGERLKGIVGLHFRIGVLERHGEVTIVMRDVPIDVTGDIPTNIVETGRPVGLGGRTED